MQDVARAVGDDDRRRRGYFADGCDAGVVGGTGHQDGHLSPAAPLDTAAARRLQRGDLQRRQPTGAPLPVSARAIAERASTTSFASSASSGSAIMVYLLTVGLGVAQ